MTRNIEYSRYLTPGHGSQLLCRFATKPDVGMHLIHVDGWEDRIIIFGEDDQESNALALAVATLETDSPGADSSPWLLNALWDIAHKRPGYPASTEELLEKAADCAAAALRAEGVIQ